MELHLNNLRRYENAIVTAERARATLRAFQVLKIHLVEKRIINMEDDTSTFPLRAFIQAEKTLEAIVMDAQEEINNISKNPDLLLDKRSVHKPNF